MEETCTDDALNTPASTHSFEAGEASIHEHAAHEHATHEHAAGEDAAADPITRKRAAETLVADEHAAREHAAREHAADEHTFEDDAGAAPAPPISAGNAGASPPPRRRKLFPGRRRRRSHVLRFVLNSGEERSFWLRTEDGRFVRSVNSQCEPSEHCGNLETHFLREIGDGYFMIKSSQGKFWKAITSAFSYRVQPAESPPAPSREAPTATADTPAAEPGSTSDTVNTTTHAADGDAGAASVAPVPLSPSTVKSSPSAAPSSPQPLATADSSSLSPSTVKNSTPAATQSPSFDASHSVASIVNSPSSTSIATYASGSPSIASSSTSHIDTDDVTGAASDVTGAATSSAKPPRPMTRPASASLGRASRPKKKSSKGGHARIRSRSVAFRSSKKKGSRSERSRDGSGGGGGGNRNRAARLKRMFGYSFQFIRKLDNKVSIRARNGKFLRMDSKGRLVADRKRVGKSEMFYTNLFDDMDPSSLTLFLPAESTHSTPSPEGRTHVHPRVKGPHDPLPDLTSPSISLSTPTGDTSVRTGKPSESTDASPQSNTSNTTPSNSSLRARFRRMSTKDPKKLREKLPKSMRSRHKGRESQADPDSVPHITDADSPSLIDGHDTINFPYIPPGPLATAQSLPTQANCKRVLSSQKPKLSADMFEPPEADGHTAEEETPEGAHSENDISDMEAGERSLSVKNSRPLVEKETTDAKPKEPDVSVQTEATRKDSESSPATADTPSKYRERLQSLKRFNFRGHRKSKRAEEKEDGRSYISELSQADNLALGYAFKWVNPLSQRHEGSCDTESQSDSVMCAWIETREDVPVWERWRKLSDGTHVISETRIESQRYAPWGFKWKAPFLPRDPFHFSDITGRTQWKPRQLRPNWEWITDWEPEVVEDVTDENGWLYGKNFVGWGQWRKKKGTFECARIRYLTRVRRTTTDMKLPVNIRFEPGELHARGTTIVDMIQHGIRIALFKDRVPNDQSCRAYFNLLNGDGIAYQFQDYAADTFGEIRSLYGIDEERYAKSMCDAPYVGGDVEASGKSGQIFWRTSDNAFVLKTVTHAEASFLQQILSDYFDHLENNPHTLISRIYGLHKVKIGSQRIRFLVMNNVFSSATVPIQLIYDLKGTTEDRLVKTDARESSTPVLKDLNFSGRRMVVSTPMMDALHAQIDADCSFFDACDVMDYSLLLGVHVGKSTSDEAQAAGERRSETDLLSRPLSHVREADGSVGMSRRTIFEGGIRGPLNETYFVGIIDILQDWTTFKQLANTYKTVRFADIGQAKIDSVPPKVYSKRFRQYFDHKIRNKVSSTLANENDNADYEFLIMIEKAENLVARDFLLRTSDPYVVAHFGEAESVTEVVKSNVNPVWSHLCSFRASKDNLPSSVKFVVWDYDWGFSPDFMGSAKLDISAFFEGSARSLYLDLKPEAALEPSVSSADQGSKPSQSRSSESLSQKTASKPSSSAPATSDEANGSIQDHDEKRELGSSSSKDSEGSARSGDAAPEETPGSKTTEEVSNANVSSAAEESLGRIEVRIELRKLSRA